MHFREQLDFEDSEDIEDRIMDLTEEYVQKAECGKIKVHFPEECNIWQVPMSPRKEPENRAWIPTLPGSDDSDVSEDERRRRRLRRKREEADVSRFLELRTFGLTWFHSLFFFQRRRLDAMIKARERVIARQREEYRQHVLRVGPAQLRREEEEVMKHEAEESEVKEESKEKDEEPMSEDSSEDSESSGDEGQKEEENEERMEEEDKEDSDEEVNVVDDELPTVSSCSSLKPWQGHYTRQAKNGNDKKRQSSSKYRRIVTEESDEEQVPSSSCENFYRRKSRWRLKTRTRQRKRKQRKMRRTPMRVRRVRKMSSRAENGSPEKTRRSRRTPRERTALPVKDPFAR